MRDHFTDLIINSSPKLLIEKFANRSEFDAYELVELLESLTMEIWIYDYVNTMFYRFHSLEDFRKKENHWYVDLKEGLSNGMDELGLSYDTFYITESTKEAIKRCP